MTSRRTFLKGASLAALAPWLSQLSWALAPAVEKKSSNTHRVLCCNIRVALPEDEAKGVGWPQRRDICLQVIKNHKPDILCLQEVLKVQSDDFRKAFSGHQLFGFDGPEMDATPTGYHGIAKNPILFSTARYELITGGTFWLSETPLLGGSLSWNTARARNASWVRLREKKTGKEFRVVNTHLDHKAQEAREKQTKLLLEEAAQYPANFPQLLAGDFNAGMDNTLHNAIREANWKDSYTEVNGPTEPGVTAHGFQSEEAKKNSKKIDFIYTKGPVKALASTIIKDKIKGQFPSDHYFVSADILL